MVHLRFKCLVTGLALLPWVLGPTPQKPARGAGHGWDHKAEQGRLHKDIVGFWELTTMTGDGLTYTGADLKGYLLFAVDHLAFEYHYAAPSDIRGVDIISFQSGIHRYRFDGMGRMETSSLIGAGGGDAEDGIFLEEPGLPRVFLIELTGDHLVLSHTFSRFEYKRVPTTPYSDLEPGVNFDTWKRRGEADEAAGQEE